MFKLIFNMLVFLKLIDDIKKILMLLFNLSICIFVVLNILIVYCIFNIEFV